MEKNKQRGILIMLVGFLLIAFSLTIPPSGSIVTGNVAFGNTDVGDWVADPDANGQSASAFYCDHDAVITDIVAYTQNALSSGPMRAAVYADDELGHPWDLIEQTSTVTVGTSFSWIVFHLSTPVSVDAYGTYWLALSSSGDFLVTQVVNTGSGTRVYNVGDDGAASFATGFSNPFGTIWGADEQGAMSIYAVEAGSDNVTPNPTSNPTSNPTVNPTPSPTPFNPTPTPAPTGTVITVGVNNPAYGTYTISTPISPKTTFEGQDNYQYLSGSTLVLQANPNSGYKFDHYTVYNYNINGLGTGTTITQNPWVTTIGSNIIVDIHYIPITQTHSDMQMYLQIIGGITAGIGAIYYVLPKKVAA